MGGQLSLLFRSHLHSAQAQKYLWTICAHSHELLLEFPKHLNRILLQQLILAALVACCFLRGLQTVPAFGVEKSVCQPS